MLVVANANHSCPVFLSFPTLQTQNEDLYKGVARTGRPPSLQLVAISLAKLLLLLHNITRKYTYSAVPMLHLH
jgi:hypothetical protein